MEISYGLVNLMYFMLCSEHWRIKGSRSNKRRKLLTSFTNSLFRVYNNLSLRETGPKVYNIRFPKNNLGFTKNILQPLDPENGSCKIFIVENNVRYRS